MSATSATEIRRTVRPYAVTDSELGVDEVMYLVNRTVFAGHGPDTRMRGGRPGVFSDTLFQYERLLRDLAAIPGLKCVPFRELLASPPAADEILCGIRHDVDIDIRCALDMARLEIRYGVRSTWFILHTAPYYGEFGPTGLRRHDSMRHVYRELQNIGHEVALHTDSLHVYQMQGRDGAAALTVEIDWLRKSGIDIVGTTAHNSASVYGAENFAIFRGRPRSFRPAGAEPHAEIVHEGRWSPLGVLDERELGLQYEANDLFWQDQVSVAYAATRGVNRWRWNSEASLGVAKRLTSNRISGFISYEELVRNVGGLPRGQYLCLVVHPVYYGARHAADSGPVLKLAKTSKHLAPRLGWITRAPHALDASCGHHDGRQEFQAINWTNADGMLDLERPAVPARTRVLLFGGVNVDGASCGVSAHLHLLAEEQVRDKCGGEISIRKFAHPDIGLARYYGWYRAVRDVEQPHFVILGIGADEPLLSLPESWARRCGFSVGRPGGVCLTVDALGAVTEIVPPATPALHAARVDAEVARPGLTGSDLDASGDRARIEALVEYFVARVRRDGAEPLLLLHECGEREGVDWATQAAPAAVASHARMRSWLTRLSDRLGVELVDPYIEFLHGADGPSHWQGSPQWNYVGHRLAAAALATALVARIATALRSIS
jgi:hypothetical protein